MGKKRVVIGVDGGGSKSIAAAAALDGEILAVCRGRGINYNSIGMEKARENLKELTDAALLRCGGECAALSIGHPALDGPADRETVCAFAGDDFDIDRLFMDSDAYMALLGASLGEKGMIVICGTGSMAVLDRGDGTLKAGGGWGHLLGDAGSGLNIALDGLRAALRHWEAEGADTALTGKALAYFKASSPRQLIARLYQKDCGNDVIARFAKIVFALAETGDRVSAEVIAANMSALAAQAAALLREEDIIQNVALYGGIFQHQEKARQLFIKALEDKLPKRPLRIGLPELPPELGALIYYYRKQNSFSERVLQNLKESYRRVRKERE